MVRHGKIQNAWMNSNILFQRARGKIQKRYNIWVIVLNISYKLCTGHKKGVHENQMQ